MLPEDLIDYGLIPEFIGRLPVITAIHQLSRDDLTTILTEPKHALTRQFQRFFEFDDIELVFARRQPRGDRRQGDRAREDQAARTPALDPRGDPAQHADELPFRVDVTICRQSTKGGRMSSQATARPWSGSEAAQQDISPAEDNPLGKETA